MDRKREREGGRASDPIATKKTMMTAKKRNPIQGEQRGEEWSKENNAEENDSRGTATSGLRAQRRWLARSKRTKKRAMVVARGTSSAVLAQRSVRWRGSFDPAVAWSGDKKSGERVYFNWSSVAAGAAGNSVAESPQGREYLFFFLFFLLFLLLLVLFLSPLDDLRFAVSASVETNGFPTSLSPADAEVNASR